MLSPLRRPLSVRNFLSRLIAAIVFCIFSENVRLISLFQVQVHDIVVELIIQIQWNPVNTDTNGTCPSVRINGVSVLSGLSEKTLQTHVLSKKRP